MMTTRIRRSRSAVAAFTVGALIGAVLLGGGAAWAYFTATAQATGQTTSRSVAITQANFQNLSQTYRNTHSTLTQTGTFTVTNTGQANGQVSVSISGSGSFLSNLPIRVWPVASTGACTAATTVPANAANGTWGSTTVASGASLNAGASIVYCVRTTIDPATQRPNIATSSGTQSAQPSLSATLSASGWSATAAAAVNTQKTEAIYPLATGYLPSNQSRWYTIRSGSNGNVCLDASGTGSANGTLLISWGCSSNSNQRWQFLPVSGDDQTLVTLQPRHAPDRRAGVSNGEQRLATGDSAETRWYVQQVSSDRYMLVSQLDGTCLSVRSAASGAAHATVECTDPSAVLDLRREGLSFSSGSSSGTLSFGSNLTSQQLDVQYRNGSGNWVTVATTTIGSSSVSLTNRDFPSGTWDGRIVFRTGGALAYSGITFEASRSGIIFTSYKLDVTAGMG